jgi:uncharacterized protein (AIM24 family)
VTATAGPAKAYLAHLSRGSDLLRAERVEDARDELEKALALRPGDARIMNLLGLVYFRLARFPEAQAIYTDLVNRQPQDPSLRLNLGLVHLKRGDVDDAIRELNRARELDPTQIRTMGYLGLAFARKGHFALARDAFYAAGQDDLATEMEAQLTTELSGVHKLPQPPPPPPSNGAGVPARATTSSEFVSAGVSTMTPLEPAPEPPASLHAPESLAEFAARRLIRPEAREVAFEVIGQALVVRVRGRVLARQAGVLATGGEVSHEPATRRVRGRVTAEPFSGEGGMSIATGNGHMVAVAREAQWSTLHLLDESLYLREDLVFAFEERLSWENGHVPGSNGSIPVVQLRGEGSVALRTAGPLLGIEVRQSRTLDVHASALAGWTGKVVPRLVIHSGHSGHSGHPGARGHTVEFSGDGLVFVEEPR